MKNFNRIILAISIIFTLFGSNVECMRQSIRAGATQAIRALLSTTGPHYLPRTAATITPHTIFKIGLPPRFSTKVDTSTDQQRADLTAQAAKNITAQDPQEIEAIKYVLNTYHQHAACQLMPAVNQEFDNIHPSILKDILTYNPNAAQDYIACLVKGNSRHFEHVLDNFMSHKKQDKYSKIDEQYDWNFSHNGLHISFSQLLIDTALKTPQIFSINAFDQLYFLIRTDWGKTDSESYGKYCNDLMLHLKAAAKKQYGINPNTLIDLYRNTIDKSQLAEPYCMYTNSSHYNLLSIHEMTLITTDKVNEVSPANLNWLYKLLKKNNFDDQATQLFQEAYKNGKAQSTETLSLADLIELQCYQTGPDDSTPSQLEEHALYEQVTSEYLGAKALKEYATATPRELEYAYELMLRNQKNQLKELLTERFKPTISTLSPDQLIVLHLQNHNNNTHRLNSHIQSLIQNTTLELPRFCYRTMVSSQDIVNTTLRDFKNTSHRTLQCVYDNFASPSERLQLKELAEKQFGTPTNNDGVIENLLNNSHDRPHFSLEVPKTYSAKSHSEKHFCDNTQSILSSLTKYKIWKEKQTRQMFNNALAQEVQEDEKGNYAFYHGRRPEWDFIADFYKHTHNLIASPDKHADKTYTFLRFDKSTSSWQGDKPIDALFLNCPLFGNSSDRGCSSAQLVLDNHDWSNNKYATFSPKFILSQFKQEKLYERYHDEINKLRTLHEKANPHNVGNLLMFVLDEQNVNRAYPVSIYSDNKKEILLKNGQTTLEAKKISQACKAGNLVHSDNIVLALPLTKDYALNPKGGLKTHTFRAGDQAAWKEYEAARDQLFTKIKTDLEADRNTKAK